MIKFDFERAINKWKPVIENTLLNRGVEYSQTLIGDIYLKIFPHGFLTFYKLVIIRDWKLNTILNG